MDQPVAMLTTTIIMHVASRGTAVLREVQPGHPERYISGSSSKGAAAATGYCSHCQSMPQLLKALRHPERVKMTTVREAGRKGLPAVHFVCCESNTAQFLT
jgi:hypothetical protein